MIGTLPMCPEASIASSSSVEIENTRRGSEDTSSRTRFRFMCELPVTSLCSS